MIKIKVPATSANLGPGFDAMGIAFTLYNEFGFEKSNKFETSGFQDRYVDPSKNLIVKSYKMVFDELHMNAIPVKVYMMDQNVPTSRGLGSSATCIVAGVLAAKHFLGDKVSYDTCFQIASKIEGHPDNIAPAMFGGMICSYTKDGIYKHVRYEVSDSLKINVLVPDFELSTAKARGVLPKSLEYKDIVYNTSRCANIPYAFQSGNIELLIDLLDDKMHEPYRMPLIEGADKIKKVAHDNGYAFAISGAGPSLLVVSAADVANTFDEFSNYKVYKLSVAAGGAIVEE